MSRPAIFFISSNTPPFLLEYFTFSHYISSMLYRVTKRAHLWVFCLLRLSTTGIPLLSGSSRSRTRNCSFSVFAYSIGPWKYFFIPLYVLTSCLSLNALLLQPCFLPLAFILFLYCLFTCVFYSLIFWMDSISFGFSPVSFHNMLTIYGIPPYSSSPFCYFLLYSPITYGWQPLFWHAPYFISAFQPSSVSSCFRWVDSQFCSKYCIVRRICILALM